MTHLVSNKKETAKINKAKKFMKGFMMAKIWRVLIPLYPDAFSVCGESAGDGELWYRSGP